MFYNIDKSFKHCNNYNQLIRIQRQCVSWIIYKMSTWTNERISETSVTDLVYLQSEMVSIKYAFTLMYVAFENVPDLVNHQHIFDFKIEPLKANRFNAPFSTYRLEIKYLICGSGFTAANGLRTKIKHIFGKFSRNFVFHSAESL